MPRKTRDLNGMKFGKLEVISFAGYKKGKYNAKAYWKCKCECGNEKEVSASQLLTRTTTSCGCSRLEDREKNDIVGEKFNRLTAIKRVYDGRKGTRYLFRCDCGKEKVILKSKVVNGETKSCGCLSVEKAKERNFKDLSNQRFGKLVALNVDKKENDKTYWMCKCDCGKKTSVLTSRLISGHTKSCGCLSNEFIEELNKTHAKSKTRVYKIYQGMKARCYRKTAPNYDNYGGRGIIICQEWLNDFMNFYNWAMENGYSDDLTIDRINNDGNYCPENCRWANTEEQANNRRTSRYVSVDGETITVAMFAKKYGIKSQIFITRRLDKGYDYKKIIEEYKSHMERKK